MIDIQERLAQGKGPAYARWAKIYNLKQMAAALQYLREHGLTDYEALAASTEAAVDRFHSLAGELRDTEEALSRTSQLMGAVVQYAKTRPVFDGYKAARLILKKYLAQHEAELADYRAAKAAINELLDGAKLPKMDTLKRSTGSLRTRKNLSIRNTARPRRICGRPWRSRQTWITCSATRTGGKIRSRSDSNGPQTIGLLDKVSRSPAGLGSSPTSIFARAPALQK